MAERFALAVCDPEGQRFPVAECLAALKAGQPVPPGELHASALALEAGGVERLAAWTFGPLAEFAAQFVPAADRLARGQPALIRSASLDGDHVPYLVLEPQADGTCLLSLTVFPDPDVNSLFPNSPAPGEAQQLYDYFQAERAHLIAPMPNGPEDDYFSLLPISTALLVESLRREAKLAGELLTHLRPEQAVPATEAWS